MIDLLNLELTDKYSTTGTNKLTGNTGSKVIATIDFIVHWELIGVDVEIAAGSNVINSNDGSDFIQAGFKVNDTFTLVGSTSDDGDYIISGISQYTLFISSADSTSGPITFVGESSVIVDIHGTTPINTIDYYFGLVENSGGAVYTSLLDGELQHYRKTGLDASGASNYTLDVFTTNKSWVTGSVTEQAATKIYEMGIGTSGASYGYEQQFRIEHEFHISPAVLRAWEDANEELDVTLISFLNQSASLKFIPRITSGFAPSGSEHSTDTGNIGTFLQNGDVGFYDEYRNGGAATYSIADAIVYESSNNVVIDELAINDTVFCTFNLARTTNFSVANARFDLYVFVVPEDLDVQNNINTIWENYDVSNVFLEDGAAPASDNRISSAEVSITTDEALFTFDFTGQSSDDGKKYLIFVDVGEMGSDTSTNDHHTILIDYRDFSLFVDTSGLIETDGALVNEHSTNDLELAYTDYKGWIEDGLLTTMYFDVKQLVGISNEFTSTLVDVEWSIDAEHQSDSTRNFNLESTTLTPSTSSTRNYKLYTGDPKNYAILTTLTPDGVYNKYVLQMAQKLRWETWALQGNADPDFVNATKNWSTYDELPDWKIYINVKLNVTLTDGTIDETYQYVRKIEARILNYDEYNGCERTGEIETYHAVSGQSLQGNLHPTVNTIVKGIFYGESLFPCIYNGVSGSGSCEYEQLSSGSGSYSSGGGAISECPDYYGILELDVINQGSPTTIRQISTVITDTESPTPWIGDLPTNMALLVAYPYASPPRIEIIATLNASLLNQNLTYKLSARLGRNSQTICDVSIMDYLISATTYQNTILTGYSADDLLIFNAQIEQTVRGNVISIVGDTITFGNPISEGLKICCSANAIMDTTAADTYSNASLIGLSQDDFLFFVESTGFEMTSIATTTFVSGTGTIGLLNIGDDIKISFHQAIISDTITASNTYVDNSLIGLSEIDVMIFVNGRERTQAGATISGNTITFPTPLTGTIKVCKVNQ
jgi:hypothetical protein